MKRKEVSGIVLETLLLVSMLTFVFSVQLAKVSSLTTNSIGESMPLLYVDPSVGTAFVGEIYAVNVRLDNVANLYGLDIRFAWGSSVLEYVWHEYHIPVEDWPDGVLNSPVMRLKDEVDVEAGTYRLVALSYASAPPFDGLGIVFTIMFRVIQMGETDLYFTYTSLTNPFGGDIPHQTQDGYFEMPGLGSVPVATFTYAPSIPVIDRTAVVFDACMSYDPDLGGITVYMWDWGDGSPREAWATPFATHTYVKTDERPLWEFPVRLSVVDVEGSQSKRVSQTVTVVHPRPVAKFTTWPPPNNRREVFAVINQDIMFNASASYDPDLEAGDPSGGIVEYRWDWDTWKQGEINTTTTTDPVCHRSYSYEKPEGFLVSLRVKDAEGLLSHPSLEVRIFVVRPPLITAALDVDPDVLNLKSKGRWITAYIQLPEDYDAADIDASTIMLNDTIQPVLDPKYDFVTNASEYLADHNNDGILERMVKFEMSAVSEYILSKGVTTGSVALTITGQLVDGTSFEGTCVIVVKMPGDINVDGIVDVRDIALAGEAFGSYPGYPAWNYLADENEDNKIDKMDLALIVENFGKTYLNGITRPRSKGG